MTRVGRLEALYELRTFLVEQHPGVLISSIDQALYDGASALKAWEKERLRDAGYQFNEDLDNVPEMFRGMRRKEDDE